MEEGFDVDNMLDSLNLTGQWQPSTMPDVLDSSLTEQILDDILLSGYDLLSQPGLINTDDISNAYIDPSMDSFESFVPTANTPRSSFDNDDITKLISSPIGQIPRQSTIEDSLESMNLNQSQTDSLTSSICIPTGSSPVEHKEIDNSILATRYVKEQQRIYKNSSKPRKSSSMGSQRASSTVGPIDVLSSYGGCQPCTTIQMQSDFDYQQQTLQFDSMEKKKIQIKCHPRSRFRPRTQNESKTASHYIRCEDNSPHDYPTIFIPHIWACQSVKNIIEVTLVGTDGQPHAYAIDNKTTKNAFEDDALIFRQRDLHTLYFCVTEEDFKNGFKSFMIEYIKSKQDDTITKDLIRSRQLDQSMLRFTRFYQSENTFERDESSVEYSHVMSEVYGDIAVEHMGPRYGPMGGNEGVYCLLKGRILKDDITVFVTEEMTQWCQQIQFTKNGNLVYFSMPAFPYSQFDSAATNILIKYKGEEFHRFNYLYSKSSLDQELAALDLNGSSSNFSGPSSSSDTFNPLDFFSATGVCPVPVPTRKSTTSKRPKRLNNNK